MRSRAACPSDEALAADLSHHVAVHYQVVGTLGKQLLRYAELQRQSGGD